MNLSFQLPFRPKYQVRRSVPTFESAFRCSSPSSQDSSESALVVTLIAGDPSVTLKPQIWPTEPPSQLNRSSLQSPASQHQPPPIVSSWKHFKTMTQSAYSTQRPAIPKQTRFAAGTERTTFHTDPAPWLADQCAWQMLWISAPLTQFRPIDCAWVCVVSQKTKWLFGQSSLPLCRCRCHMWYQATHRRGALTESSLDQIYRQSR